MSNPVQWFSIAEEDLWKWHLSGSNNKKPNNKTCIFKSKFLKFIYFKSNLKNSYNYKISPNEPHIYVRKQDLKLSQYYLARVTGYFFLLLQMFKGCGSRICTT